MLRKNAFRLAGPCFSWIRWGPAEIRAVSSRSRNATQTAENAVLIWLILHYIWIAKFIALRTRTSSKCNFSLVPSCSDSTAAAYSWSRPSASKSLSRSSAGSFSSSSSATTAAAFVSSSSSISAAEVALPSPFGSVSGVRARRARPPQRASPRAARPARPAQ
mgnify:FL=1